MVVAVQGAPHMGIPAMVVVQVQGASSIITFPISWFTRGTGVSTVLSVALASNYVMNLGAY
jgi:hypothetical protein